METSAQSRKAAASTDDKRVLRYQHVYDLVVNLIDDQDLNEGDQLPSTTELAGMADVSIITVRRALDELERNGKVVRHQGVGTFVAPSKLVSEPARSGALLSTLGSSQAEADLKTELVGLIVGVPSAKHAAALGIDLGEPVWEISRMRSVGSHPKVLERAVLPLSLVPALDEAKLAAGASLYEFLAERYGLRDDFVEQAIEVDDPTSWEREHLGLGAKDAVVRIRGVSVSEAGVAFDSFQQTYRAREFVFYLSGSSSRKLLEPGVEGSPWTIRPLGRPE